MPRIIIGKHIFKRPRRDLQRRITVTTATGTSDEILPATGFYGAEIDGFAADIADGGERLATGEDGVHLITLTEAVQRALR